MATNWVSKPVNWTIKDIGAPLLDSIARGLYAKLEVFREYVQNAVDSYVDFPLLTGLAPRNVVQVWVDQENATLHIMDYGVGMDEEDINTAKKIAVSPKLSRSTEFAGFRGLGIWSGLSACEKLILTTSKIGVPYAYRLTIDCKDIVERIEDPIPIDELLEGHFDIEEGKWNPDEHFTQVKLVNVNRDRYGELLDAEAMTRYAERNLPVAFDPAWKPYKEVVEGFLKDVPWASANYELTINNSPVYRQLPPPSDSDNPESGLIKAPELHIITDDAGKQVAVAWVCETSRRGSKKAIEVAEKPWVRHFAIRVRNFAVGSRGLYADNDIADVGNLEWYVGEIYVTDPDIRPDTKRTQFQPSHRYDEVIRAIRGFYQRTALRARAWSAQANIENSCASVRAITNELEALIERAKAPGADRAVNDELGETLSELQKLEEALLAARAESNRKDTPEDAERNLIVRGYLRRAEVKVAIDEALGKIAAGRRRVEHEVPSMVLTSPRPSRSTPRGRSRSRSRTSRLQGDNISLGAALGNQAVVGVLPGFDTKTSENSGQIIVPLPTALAAFRAAVAAILGDENESYQRIMDRVPEELRRRGVNV